MITVYLALSIFSFTYIVGQGWVYMGVARIISSPQWDKLKKDSTTGISLWAMVVFAISTALFVMELMK